MIETVSEYEPIDLCALYDPIVEFPQELINQYSDDYEPEPTLENTSFYATELDGTEYFYCGNTRIKVTEHFASKGKSTGELIEEVIRYAIRNEADGTAEDSCQ